MRLQRGRESDLAEVIALAQASADGPRWPEASWGRYLESESEGAWGVLLLARRDEGELMGWLAASGLDERTELDFVLVGASWRGLGTAERLIEGWFAEARGRAACEAMLEVRGSNLAALRLYRRLGFQECGRRREYYRAPTEDAIVLGRRLESGMLT